MLTALVVDDAPAARRRVASLLQLAGWQVLEVTGPGAAARAAAQLRPHLVVTELRMRRGSGLALIEQLRRSGSRARFLLTTAGPTSTARAQASAAGVPLLDKPVDPRRLIDFLGGRTTGPAAQEPRPRIRVTAERVGQPPAADRTPEDEAPGLRDRRHDFLLSLLPHHLAAIADSARAGDAAAGDGRPRCPRPGPAETPRWFVAMNHRGLSR